MPGFEKFGDAERKEVMDVLESGVLMRYGFDPMRNGHWKAKEMEAELAKTFGTKHAQLVSSGTAALTVALAAAGVGAGDEVIMPTFTFVASFESVMFAGATPILVDVDDTLTLSPEAVRKAITPRTRVVMPVHMCGSMADLDALKAICEEHDLILLEDACQAIGGTYKGKRLGSIGHLGCFSFDYVKTITCGEGGGVITDNDEYALNCDHYQDHGHDHIGANRGLDKHPFLGYNFRISELNAAVGLAQIRRLDEFVAIQRTYKKILKDKLSQIEGLTFRRLPDVEGDNASFLTFFLPTEAQTIQANKALADAGVDVCFYWYVNNWHYVNHWEHLTDKISLGRLSKDLLEGLQDIKNTDFSASDAVMSRAISSLVKIGWTKEQVEERAEKMYQAIKSVM